MIIGISLALSQFRPTIYTYQNAFAAAAVARMTVKPPYQVAVVLDAYCAGLASDGVMAKLDFLYIHALHSAQSGLINIAQNRFDCTAVNSPTFTQFRGYSFDGVSSYLNTGLNPSTSSSILMLQNSLSLGYWSLTALANAGAQSNDIGNGGLRIGRNTSNSAASRINTGSTLTAALTAYPGFVGVDRSASNAWKGYKGNAAVTTASDVSVAPLNETIHIGRSNSAGFGVNQIAISWGGQHMTDADWLALYTRNNTLLTNPAIGAV